ncbi:hypothetical protein C6P46_005775 [Rhodotorula mucilaginosa]|uniref:Mitochondrial import inner membrane translocase subunit n=1 Tax=Rhodotorula mucilaginosa TaxID=5537 RepID=A0A9P6VYA1_RHOMI|nr:hypothetical protein C6P46_005775 [Rhodotorula mucilaginosa]
MSAQQATPQGLEQFDEATRASPPPPPPRPPLRLLTLALRTARVADVPRAGTDKGSLAVSDPHFHRHLLGPGAPGARFSRGEEACLSNCVDRFLDSSLFIVKSLEERKGHM